MFARGAAAAVALLALAPLVLLIAICIKLDSRGPVFFSQTRSGLGGQPFRPTVAKIQRLGHVVWTTPRYNEALAFFRNVLNFAESDSIGQGVTFFRAFPNPYHHGIGIARGQRNQFHHLNFMVTEIDDVGRGLARFHEEF